jgi:hypothetical protein
MGMRNNFIGLLLLGATTAKYPDYIKLSGMSSKQNTFFVFGIYDFSSLENFFLNHIIVFCLEKIL